MSEFNIKPRLYISYHDGNIEVYPTGRWRITNFEGKQELFIEVDRFLWMSNWVSEHRLVIRYE